MSRSDDIGCQQALERLWDFVDHELSENQIEKMERHLRACRACFSRVEFEARLKQRLADLSSDETSTKARDRIREIIKGF